MDARLRIFAGCFGCSFCSFLLFRCAPGPGSAGLPAYSSFLAPLFCQPVSSSCSSDAEAGEEAGEEADDEADEAAGRRSGRRSSQDEEARASSQGQAGEGGFFSPARRCSDSSDSSSDVESYLWPVDDDGRMEVDESGEEAGGDDTQDDPVL